MNNSLINRDIQFVFLGLLLGALFTSVWNRIVDNDEALMRLADCQTDSWREYEDRTGKMPSEAIAQVWWDDCNDQ